MAHLRNDAGTEIEVDDDTAKEMGSQGWSTVKKSDTSAGGSKSDASASGSKSDTSSGGESKTTSSHKSSNKND